MAKNWWDVEDPKDFFGVQGERNATQQANVDRFIEEWEEVSDNSRTSRSTLNGLIDGTYDASLVADNWGSNTSLSGLERVKSYSDTIGEYEGDFGSYLRQEWDNFNTSQGVDLGGLNTSPTIGTVASDGPSGRASIETPERLSMQSYVDAILAAAKEADVPLGVDSPDGAYYELNYGQFDDVPLGGYKQVREPSSIGPNEFLEMGTKFLLSTIVTGGVGAFLGSLANGAGAVASLSAGIQGGLANLASMASGLANLPSSIVKAITDPLGGVADPNGGMIYNFSEAGNAINDIIKLNDFVQNESVVNSENAEDIITNEDALNTVLEDGVQAGLDIVEAIKEEQKDEAPPPEDVITEEEEVSLEADPDLMGTATIEETIGDEDFTTAPLPTPEIIVDEVPIDEIPIEITEPEVEFVDPSTDSGGGGGGGEESGGDSSAGAGTTATTGGTEAAGGANGDPVITRDVGAVDDDPLIVNEGDIVGRQLKEAYEAETDPELKEDLKEELIAWLEGQAGEPEPVPTTEQPPESTFDPAIVLPEVVTPVPEVVTETPEAVDLLEEVIEEVSVEDIVDEDVVDIGDVVDGGGAGTDGDGVDTGDGGEAGGGDSTGVADGSGAGAGEGTGEGSGTGEGTGEGEGSGTGGGSGGMLSDSGGQGYMGGFNYNLPQFVPVAYQPKDYDVELNRIINQSLFKGMI